MKVKLAAISLMTAVSLVVAPVTPASAHDHHHHGGGLIAGVIGAGVALTAAAVTVATAPVRVVANAVTPYPYAAPVQSYAAPVYYAPAPVRHTPIRLRFMPLRAMSTGSRFTLRQFMLGRSTAISSRCMRTRSNPVAAT